jgi:hypothetical protein
VRTITSKNQLSLPLAACRTLGWTAGTKLRVRVSDPKRREFTLEAVPQQPAAKGVKR